MTRRPYEKELRQRVNGIKQRCTNKNRHNYYLYGGKGICVCDEWNESFDKFYEWAINSGYKPGLSIERLNTDKGYSQNNCTWIPINMQGKNRSSSWMIEYNGKTQCLSDWSKELGFKRTTIQRRMNNGLTFEQALHMPLRMNIEKYKLTLS